VEVYDQVALTLVIDREGATAEPSGSIEEGGPQLLAGPFSS